MYTKVMSAGVFGMNAYPVEVEVDTIRGLPSFEIGIQTPDSISSYFSTNTARA